MTTDRAATEFSPETFIIANWIIDKHIDRLWDEIMRLNPKEILSVLKLRLGVRDLLREEIAESQSKDGSQIIGKIFDRLLSRVDWEGLAILIAQLMSDTYVIDQD